MLHNVSPGPLKVATGASTWARTEVLSRRSENCAAPVDASATRVCIFRRHFKKSQLLDLLLSCGNHQMGAFASTPVCSRHTLLNHTFILFYSFLFFVLECLKPAAYGARGVSICSVTGSSDGVSLKCQCGPGSQVGRNIGRDSVHPGARGWEDTHSQTLLVRSIHSPSKLP